MWHWESSDFGRGHSPCRTSSTYGYISQRDKWWDSDLKNSLQVMLDLNPPINVQFKSVLFMIIERALALRNAAILYIHDSETHVRSRMIIQATNQSIRHSRSPEILQGDTAQDGHLNDVTMLFWGRKKEKNLQYLCIEKSCYAGLSKWLTIRKTINL